jgi:hypothetical protein
VIVSRLDRARVIRWTPKQWQAVCAAVNLLSIKGTPRSVRYVTINAVAHLGGCGRAAARVALTKLDECGAIYCSAPASGC